MADKLITIDALIELLNQYSHTELHVHHTYIPSHKDFNGSNYQERQDAMRRFHVNTNGWDDIAQHVTLFPDGKFLTGRDFHKQPISIKGYNGSNGKYPFAVEMLGNFDVGHDKLEGKQLDSILHLAKYFHDKGRYIRFHRENAPKTCPGTGIDKDVFMKQVEQYGVKPVKQATEIESAIKTVKELGIMNGYPNGHFGGDKPITRAEIALVVTRLIKHLTK